jgi:hypothetical protein
LTALAPAVGFPVAGTKNAPLGPNQEHRGVFPKTGGLGALGAKKSESAHLQAIDIAQFRALWAHWAYIKELRIREER